MNEEEMRQANIENEINTYQQLLAQTDYKCLKHAEGALSDEEYEATKIQRQEWRQKINELQAVLTA